MKCAIDGCANTPTQIAAHQNDVVGLALDSSDVFWTNTNATGGIATCAKAGCGTPTTLTTSLWPSGGIALTIDLVIWGRYGPFDDLVQCAKTGCIGSPATMATNQPYPIGVVVDSTNVYWGDFDTNSIVKCPIGGCNGPPTLVAKTIEPTWLAIDGANIYWVGAGSVSSCPLSACASATVVAEAVNKFETPAVMRLVTNSNRGRWVDVDG